VPSVPRTVELGPHRLTRIGLGTNRLTDSEQNRSSLVAAVEAGINFVDTAHLYTGGESERAIGAALERVGDHEVVVATKGGYRGGGSANLRSELEQSFESLRVGRIPLYYLHRVDPDVPLEESVALLDEYREAGRIGHIGLSEVSVEQIERARSVAPITAVQNEYNLAERRHEPVLDFCDREGILFVPFYPLHGDRRRLREIADRHGATPTQVKLAWLLSRSPQVAPIPGTLSIDHVRENLGALELELSEEELSALRGR
jgi:aryl-alcohol dehydrogenase-like predicted oxidoreductase